MYRAPLALLALLLGCTWPGEPLPGRTVGPGWAEGGGSFNTGTRVTVRARTFERPGGTEVCAAWAADGVTAGAGPHLRRVIDTGVIQVGGRPLVTGLWRFPRAASRAALAGASAGCVAVGRDWQPGETRVRFGRIALDRDDDGHVAIWFVGDR